MLWNKLGDKVVKRVTTDEDLSLNTSDQFNIITETKTDLKVKTMQVKLKWENCDNVKYQRSVRQNLLRFDTVGLSTNSEIDILQPLAYLNAVLKQAVYDSIPKNKPTVTIKSQRRRCWTQKIQEAMKNCFGGNGAKIVSLDPTNPALQNMIKAKKA